MLNINVEKISFITFFIIASYENFIKLRSMYDPLKIIKLRYDYFLFLL